MTAWLKLVPSWVWLAGAWALSLVLVGGVQQLRFAGAQVQAAGALSALADYKTEVSERDRKATLAALQETKRRMAVIDEVDTNATKELDVARADLANAGTALERLQRRVEAAEKRSRDAGNAITAQLSASADASARMRADLLGRIGQAAGLYAGVADDRGVAGSACERVFDGVKGNVDRAQDELGRGK